VWSRIRSLGGGVLVVATVLWTSGPVSAACYSQNTLYWSQDVPVATACIHDYQHGNYGGAYSQIRRLNPPPGYPAYCTYGGTKVTHGSPLGEGSLAWSVTTWAQSFKNPGSIIGSSVFAYRAGTYYSGTHSVPGIGC